MISILEYINNSNDTISKEQLPLTFDIYNEGQKNKNFEITKKSLKKEFSKLRDLKIYNIILPISKDYLTYEETIDKHNTNDFTKMPKVVKFIDIPLYANEKYSTSKEIRKYNEGIDAFLVSLKPYIKNGKISVSIDISDYTDKWKTYFELKVNDNAFNKDREEQIAKMEDESNLERWKKEEEAKEAKRKKEIEEYKEKERKDKEEYERWLDNLSPEDKEAHSRGYGPHHWYEETHNFPGYRGGGVWHTGD